MKKASAFFLSMTVILSGCSIHPAPENFSGVYTLNIVQSIRCEARDAFRLYLGKLLSDQSDERFWDDDTADLANRLTNGDTDLSTLERKNLSLGARTLLAKFDRATIVYDFKFQMTERNNNELSAALTDPLSNGLFTLGFGGGANLERDAQRSFRVVDIFSEFYSEEMYQRCNVKMDRLTGKLMAGGRFANRPDYPITGKIGLDDVMWTAMHLVQTVGLAAKEKAEDASVSTFVERLTFTTTLKGNLDPSVELKGGSRHLHVSNVSGKFGSERVDLHEVTIAIGLNPGKGASSLKATIAELNRQQELDAYQSRRGF